MKQDYGMSSRKHWTNDLHWRNKQDERERENLGISQILFTITGGSTDPSDEQWGRSRGAEEKGEVEWDDGEIVNLEHTEICGVSLYYLPALRPCANCPIFPCSVSS